jgi:type VI secretion system protein ImpM
MSPNDSAPGWYGKLPSLGDFVSRRLPPDFLVAWDHWLQRGMLRSQEQLGPDWRETFQTAPVWAFALGEHIFGMRQTWVGIVLPSVDRVGRYFPLTLCAAMPDFSFAGEALTALETWLGALDAVARDGLDSQMAVAEFDARLVDCQPPRLPVPQSARADNMSPCGGAVAFDGDSDFTWLDRPGADSLAALIGNILVNTPFAPYSLWWCYNADDTVSGFTCRGMPDAEMFVRMLRNTRTK